MIRSPSRSALPRIKSFAASLGATLVQLDPHSYRVEVAPQEDDSFKLKNPLWVTLELYRGVCIELSRNKGDYLAFVDFFVLMSLYFQ